MSFSCRTNSPSQLKEKISHRLKTSVLLNTMFQAIKTLWWNNKKVSFEIIYKKNILVETWKTSFPWGTPIISQSNSLLIIPYLFSPHLSTPLDKILFQRNSSRPLIMESTSIGSFKLCLHYLLSSQQRAPFCVHNNETLRLQSERGGRKTWENSRQYTKFSHNFHRKYFSGAQGFP